MHPGAAGRAQSTLDLDYAQFSDPGRVREQNEDYLGCFLPDTPEQARAHGWLFALADGVGGQERGEVASRAAIEFLLAGFRSASAGEAHPALLSRLVQAAHVHVYDTGMAAAPGGVAMATTVVACALRFDHATVAHVGDSRCYLVRRGHATPLTRDHTLANEQLRLGVLSAREAAHAETRHLLSRSLGSDLFVAVDISHHQVFPGDVLGLCSDGWHGAVSPAEIASHTGRGADLAAAARDLLALANQRDGSDNMSVQLIRVRGVERVGMYRGRPYKLR